MLLSEIASAIYRKHVSDNEREVALKFFAMLGYEQQEEVERMGSDVYAPLKRRN